MQIYVINMTKAKDRLSRIQLQLQAQRLSWKRIEAIDGNEPLFLEEAADLFFHYLILLKAKGKNLEDIVAVLENRKR